MRYSPNIQTDTYFTTTGKEYMNKSGVEYIGDYHLKMNLPFTGRQHDNNSIRLIKYNTDTNYINYINLNSHKLNIYSKPITFIPTPDYTTDFITRYFIKKRNDNSANIIEIDEKQYKSLKKPNSGLNQNYYSGIELKWKVKGYLNDVIDSNGTITNYGVIDTNNRTVIQKQKEMKGLSIRLSNLSEFYQ